MTRVLIVEDDTPIRHLLDDFLTCEGFDTLQAENGRVGVELAGTMQPDLILMDVMLPELDGITATRVLKDNSRTSAIRVVAMTAHTTLLRPGDDFPADDVISKPFDLDALLDVIAAQIAVLVSDVHEVALREVG